MFPGEEDDDDDEEDDIEDALDVDDGKLDDILVVLSLTNDFLNSKIQMMTMRKLVQLMLMRKTTKTMIIWKDSSMIS